MRIKLKDAEFEFLPEDLRHFKINDSADLAKFIKTLEVKKVMGFKPEKKKN